jgi:antitoxin component YwqK of YwqJK toxin-antitoxin module
MMYFMNDTIDMHWGDTGFGYGCGDKYIITAHKFESKLCGDITVFSADNGKVIMKAEYSNGVPHGTFSVYNNDNVIEEGICIEGSIVFHARRRHGKLIEYGYIKNKQMHGRGVIIDDNGTVFRSPHWNHGKIDGLASVQDKNGEVIYYGKFKNHNSVKEVSQFHPFLIDTHLKSTCRSDLQDVAERCVEYLYI